ncbi:GAP family protein [Dermatobacter hominis]|uniref:GAP family protein n=1 Tax=Dermatobacter hominis TaxID=2884263 RepID=UPI001D12AB45|nr:GAP family protein [Dermatobacter hominis]UDY36323.1 GAP family protein [Dermatobacter hominis]
MGELLSHVLPLAVGAAISPTVLAVALLILSSPRRPVARGVAFVGGVLVVLAGLSVVGLRLPQHVGRPSPLRLEVTRTIDLVVGVLLLILAAATLLRMLATDRAAPVDPGDAPAGGRAGHPEREGLGSAAVLGAAMMIGNFSTILLYLPAMHEIARSHACDADKAVALVVAVAITSLPATLPLLVRVAAPGPAARSFASVHAWVARHSSQVALVVEVVFGVWLVWKGR